MSLESRKPRPTPLEFITPTQLGQGEKCLWRLGFSRDPQVSSLNRPSPVSALGDAIHEVTRQLGGPGQFDDVWDRAVSRSMSALTRAWAPASPPSPETWPGWSLKRVRMRKAWARSVGRTHSPSTVRYSPPGKSSSSPPPLPWRERWLQHSQLPLAGKPDLIERKPDGVWVVDLKTGLNQADPTDEQLTQLLFYSELVESEIGEAPSHAAIETTQGSRYWIAVDFHEVKMVRDRALSVLSQINELRGGELADSFASPSADACGWCSFRPACGPFFDAYDETWPIAHALLFEVVSVASSPHGYSLQATVRRPRWRENEELHVVGFPFATPPNVGELWASVNFAGRASSAIASWNTAVYRWQSQPA